jgi:phosphotransferase system  glucose/maltose/N-acetylglucosamine-specific IIC component
MLKLITKTTAPALAWVLAVPAMAQSIDPIDPATGFDKESLTTTLEDLAQWLLGIIGVIAVIMILYGAFLYITAAGNDESIAKAKSVIIYGLIGVLIAILSFAIVSFVASFVS